MRLTKGIVYETDNLRCVAWVGTTFVDHDAIDISGYDAFAYFDAIGTYRGPDENGVEPVFEAVEVDV